MNPSQPDMPVPVGGRKIVFDQAVRHTVVCERFDLDPNDSMARARGTLIAVVSHGSDGEEQLIVQRDGSWSPIGLARLVWLLLSHPAVMRAYVITEPAVT